MTNLTNNGLNQLSIQFQRLQNQFRQAPNDVDRKELQDLYAEEQETTTAPELETQVSNSNRPRLELTTPINITIIHPNSQHEQDQNTVNENKNTMQDVLIETSEESSTTNNVFGLNLPDVVVVHLRNIENDRSEMLNDFQQKVEPHLPTNVSPISDPLLAQESWLEEYNLDQVNTKEENKDNLNTTTNVDPEKKTGQTPEKKTGQVVKEETGQKE